MKMDLLKNMNLPNKLTCLRMAMIPFFVVFMYLPQSWARYVALAIFVVASLTDTADGYIARTFHNSSKGIHLLLAGFPVVR